MTRDGTVPVSIDVRVDAREAEDVPGTRQHGGISNCFATERTQTGVVGKGYALGVRRRARGRGRDGEGGGADDALLGGAVPPLGELEPDDGGDEGDFSKANPMHKAMSSRSLKANAAT